MAKIIVERGFASNDTHDAMVIDEGVVRHWTEDYDTAEQARAAAEKWCQENGVTYSKESS